MGYNQIPLHYLTPINGTSLNKPKVIIYNFYKPHSRKPAGRNKSMSPSPKADAAITTLILSLYLHPGIQRRTYT